MTINRKNWLGIIIVFVSLVILAAPFFVFAHPGRTDAFGCHTCWTNCSSWGLSYGEYHCHNSKGLAQPTYPVTSTYGSGGTGYTVPAPKYTSPSYPTTHSCPSMSRYDSLSGNCKCYSGYVVDTDYSGRETCVSASSKCVDLLGYGATYNSLMKNCECRYGYIQSGGKCVSERTYCNNQLGLMSRYNSLLDRCECMTGYDFNDTSCVYRKTDYSNTTSYSSTSNNCPSNSHTSANDSKKCQCDSGYQVNSTEDACVLTPKCSDGYVLNSNSLCVTYTQGCKSQNNNDPNIVGVKEDNGKISCNCINGYNWNGSKCVTSTKTTNQREIPEGTLIRAKGDVDVYIVKYVDLKRFKRLILSPSVFNNYGHLRWSDIKDVDKSIIDSFTNSELVRAVGDDKIYRLDSQGDTGQKRLIKNNSVLARLGLDLDSIYEINAFDRNSYVTGDSIE